MGTLTFRLPEDLRAEVKIEAAKRNSSVQEICQEALRQYLAKLKKKGDQ